jgi:hypothetical protein
MWEFSEIEHFVILGTMEAGLAMRSNRPDDARIALVTQFIAQTLLW